MNAERLRQELVRRQAGTSGREFARKLGISESYWSLIKRGERPLTLAVIERALREFPDLAPLFAAELVQRDADWLASQTPIRLPRRAGLDRRVIGRVLFNGVLAATVAAGLVVAAFGPSSRTQRFTVFGVGSGAAFADEESEPSAPRPTRTPTPTRTATRTPTPTSTESSSSSRSSTPTPSAIERSAGTPSSTPTRTPKPTAPLSDEQQVESNSQPSIDEIDCENLDQLSGGARRRARHACAAEASRDERPEDPCARKTAPPTEECRNEDSEESNNDSEGGPGGSSGDGPSY